MNLREIRHDFIEKSGREDLATTTAEGHDTDAGADNYILAAIRALDGEQETPISEAQLVRILGAGNFLISFTGCRSVTQVWRQVADEAMTELVRMSGTELREKYPLLGGTVAGTPANYAPYPVVSPPEQRDMGLPVEYSGIILMPPADASYVITLVGMFRSLPLVNNLDKNFWSVRYPDVLVLAALRELEYPYRNTTGAKDYSDAIGRKLDGIDKDLAERTMEASPRMVMEG